MECGRGEAAFDRYRPHGIELHPERVVAQQEWRLEPEPGTRRLSTDTMNSYATALAAEIAQELPTLLWDSIRSWNDGRHQEVAAVFLLAEHGPWPAKLAEAGLLRLAGPNGEHLDAEHLGKSPAEEVWTYVEWNRVAELVAAEASGDPLAPHVPMHATRSEWAVLGFASSLMTSTWSPLLASVDADNTKLMHAALAWARSGEEDANAFLD